MLYGFLLVHDYDFDKIYGLTIGLNGVVVGIDSPILAKEEAYCPRESDILRIVGSSIMISRTHTHTITHTIDHVNVKCM